MIVFTLLTYPLELQEMIFFHHRLNRLLQTHLLNGDCLQTVLQISVWTQSCPLCPPPPGKIPDRFYFEKTTHFFFLNQYFRAQSDLKNSKIENIKKSDRTGAHSNNQNVWTRNDEKTAQVKKVISIIFSFPRPFEKLRIHTWSSKVLQWLEKMQLMNVFVNILQFPF